MDLKETQLLGAEEGLHWYYLSKLHMLERCIAGHPSEQILDVGAGSGFFAKMLLRETAAKSAICVDAGYAKDWSATSFGKPIAFRKTNPLADADLVLFIDVLEHVDDDVALLREYAAAARSGARFVVSVPAFSWLWSPHDEFLEHRRRYTLTRILRVVSEAGLTPTLGFYFFATLFPAVAALRLWRRFRGGRQLPKSDLHPQPMWNSLLTGVCKAESAIARHNRAFGLTAFAVAQKA